MAKKEAEKKDKNMASTDAGKEVKKDSLKLKDTNIAEYGADQLLDMWNGSTDDESFQQMFPEATFTRSQAKYQLEKEYGMVYSGGFMVPRGIERDQIIELIKSISDDVQRASSKQYLIYSCAGKHKRITISVKAKTLERWQALLEERGVKKSMLHGYYTLALESFMEVLEKGVMILFDM